MSMKQYAKGRRPLGIMNKLEERFSFYLETLKRAGEFIWWAYEPIRFRLAANTTYTPDFVVMTKDLELQVFEVKGRWLQSARVKIKVASELYPFRFTGVMWDSKGKSWKMEEF
jgi:hypothetical protein